MYKSSNRYRQIRERKIIESFFCKLFIVMCLFRMYNCIYRSCSDEQRGAWASFYKEKGLTYYNTSNKCMDKLKGS